MGGPDALNKRRNEDEDSNESAPSDQVVDKSSFLNPLLLQVQGKPQAVQ